MGQDENPRPASRTHEGSKQQAPSSEDDRPRTRQARRGSHPGSIQASSQHPAPIAPLLQSHPVPGGDTVILHCIQPEGSLHLLGGSSYRRNDVTTKLSGSETIFLVFLEIGNWRMTNSNFPALWVETKLVEKVVSQVCSCCIIN